MLDIILTVTVFVNLAQTQFVQLVLLQLVMPQQQHVILVLLTLLLSQLVVQHIVNAIVDSIEVEALVFLALLDAYNVPLQPLALLANLAQTQLV